MPGFGENLRREREMRGVTLDEISESTKISTRFLKALEHDGFSELPGGVFTRSFIRAYAQYLGLDEEHVLAEYKRAAQPASEIDLARLSASRPLPTQASSRARVTPWVVAVVLLASGYALYRYAHRPTPLPPFPISQRAQAEALPVPSGASPTGGSSQPSASDGSTRASPSSDGPADSAAKGGESVSSSAAGSHQPGAPASGAPAAPIGAGQAQAKAGSSGSEVGPSSAASPSTAVLGEGDLVLEVATTQETWLAVAADGKTLMQGLLPPNSARTFRAKDAFDVTTGNAEGTILRLNGEAQKSLGRSGEFRKIHLTRSDVQQHVP
ncbi:MAG TPA: RodZ domain-containing protein [Terriglobia bacterium]|nr:RodZ domain-containing protein [Terriglobia bacterium]